MVLQYGESPQPFNTMKSTLQFCEKRTSTVPGIHSRLMKYYLMLGGIAAFVLMVVVNNP